MSGHVAQPRLDLPDITIRYANTSEAPRTRTRGRLFRLGSRNSNRVALMSRIHPAATANFTIVHEVSTTSTLHELGSVENYEENRLENSNTSTHTKRNGCVNCTSEHELVCKYVDGLLEKDEDVPSEFVCPITTVCMRDPVLAIDGITYERNAITKWLQRACVSPITREPMGGEITTSGDVVGNHPLYFNLALRNSIQRWAGEHARNDLGTLHVLQNVLLAV